VNQQEAIAAARITTNSRGQRVFTEFSSGESSDVSDDDVQCFSFKAFDKEGQSLSIVEVGR